MQMAYPIPENKKRNRVKKTSCELDFNLTICEGLTFENGADVLPYGYGSGSVVLPQRQLHVEERHATKDGHQNVGNEESTCNGGTRGEMMVMMRVGAVSCAKTNGGRSLNLE